MMEHRFRHPRGATTTLTTLWIAALAGCGGDEPANAPAGLNGCSDSTYVDRSAASAARVVTFGGAGGSGAFAYAPRCITVAAGQSVTFTGDFSTHPLAPGSSPTAADAGSPGNPIPRQDTNAVPSVSVTFARAGDYPYYCAYHYAAGMTGVVRVR